MGRSFAARGIPWPELRPTLHCGLSRYLRKKKGLAQLRGNRLVRMSRTLELPWASSALGRSGSLRCLGRRTASPRESPRSSSELRCRSRLRTSCWWRGLFSTVRTFHRSLHGACEPGHGTSVVSLAEKDLVGTVLDPVVGECFEKLDSFAMVRVSSPGRFRLARPVDGYVFRVTFLERLPVLFVPGIVQGLHQPHILFHAQNEHFQIIGSGFLGRYGYSI